MVRHPGEVCAHHREVLAQCVGLGVVELPGHRDVPAREHRRVAGELGDCLDLERSPSPIPASTSSIFATYAARGQAPPRRGMCN